jgi:hypothetical protein
MSLFQLKNVLEVDFGGTWFKKKLIVIPSPEAQHGKNWFFLETFIRYDMHDQYCGTNKFSYAIVSYHFLEET